MCVYVWICIRVRTCVCVWYTKSCVRACAACWLKRHFEKDRQHGRRRAAVYTDSCSYAHRPFVSACVCACVYTRGLAYVCACVSQCVSDRVVCRVSRVCIMLLCCTLRARAAQSGRRGVVGGACSCRAKRPAPSPTVCGSRRDRSKHALDVPVNGCWRPIAASARILDTLGQPRIPGRQLPSPPFCTGGGGVPPPATLRRVVFHRCARIIHGDDDDACVRECVRARVHTTCRFGKPFDYIILIYYIQIIIIIITYYNKLVTKTNNITRAWNTHRVYIVVFGCSVNI